MCLASYGIKHDELRDVEDFAQQSAIEGLPSLRRGRRGCGFDLI
jgi:hypothetical protein